MTDNTWFGGQSFKTKEEQLKYFATVLGIPFDDSTSYEELESRGVNYLKEQDCIVPITVFFLGKPVPQSIATNRTQVAAHLGVPSNFGVNLGQEMDPLEMASFNFTLLQNETELKDFVKGGIGSITIVSVLYNQSKCSLCLHFENLSKGPDFPQFLSKFRKELQK